MSRARRNPSLALLHQFGIDPPEDGVLTPAHAQAISEAIGDLHQRSTGPTLAEALDHAAAILDQEQAG